MLEVSRSAHLGYRECEFAKECINKNKACPFIDIRTDDLSQLKVTKSLGLKPKEVPAIWYGAPSGDDSKLLEIEVCESAQTDKNIIEALRALWPQLFIDDPKEIAALKEADNIVLGVIEDPDQISTNLGLEMLDKVTSSRLTPWPDEHKLTDISGVLETVPVYNLSSE